MAKVRIVNLVNQHKKMAEEQIQQLIEAGVLPKRFSGVICPKYGNMIFIWQFNNNKLVGSNAIHINNVDVFCKKIVASRAGPDFLSLATIAFKKENDGSRDEPDTAES